MKHLPIQGRTLALLAVLLPLIALLVYVALRAGPLASVPVTVATVESREVAPGLFGIGTVEARYTYKIGPTVAGRVKRLDVHVGERVKAGQQLGEMDPVDIDDRILAQDAAVKRTAAQLREAEARQLYAQSQARRYEKLVAQKLASEETVATKQQELQIADAGLHATREELVRVRAEQAGLIAQRTHLQLVAPVDGLVVSRDADPGTTVVAGQAVVEIIDPASLWINVRFDQISAQGLAAGLPAGIVLRSHAGQSLPGRLMRIEPQADAVTEEILAKAVFAQLPDPLPPLGELAEVTVSLPPLAAQPTVPNASLQRLNGALGVWRIENGDLQFAPVTAGARDLDGQVQILAGVKAGEQIVVYSQRTLTARSAIKIVDHLPGVVP